MKTASLSSPLKPRAKDIGMNWHVNLPYSIYRTVYPEKEGKFHWIRDRKESCRIILTINRK